MIKQLTTAALQIDERQEEMDNFTVIKNLFKQLDKIWKDASEEEKQLIIALIDKFNNFKF